MLCTILSLLVPVWACFSVNHSMWYISCDEVDHNYISQWLVSSFSRERGGVEATVANEAGILEVVHAAESGIW